MLWEEACEESIEGIAIRTEVKLNYTQTFIAFSNGDCITHPVNNPFNEMKIRKVDAYAYSDKWEPSECLGPVYPNDIEKGLVPITDPAAMKVAKAYFKEKVSESISSFYNVDSDKPVITKKPDKNQVKTKSTFYDELAELDMLLDECEKD